MQFKVGIGQDSHRFDELSPPKQGTGHKPLRLGGVEVSSELILQGNSDADVVLHALCNAISGISGKIIIGPYTDRLCKSQGITDSAVYVKEALKTLRGYKIVHVSIAIECLKPKIVPWITKIRNRIAKILNTSIEDVGITATTGEGLTPFGKGLGIQTFVVVTAKKG